MPFKLQISRVEYGEGEIAISGKLVEGAYVGPEAVLVKGKDGRSITTVVTHHSLYLPEDWPVLPSHDSVLTICIHEPSCGFRIDESQAVIGRGAITENDNRIDISHVLSDRIFWAMELRQRLASEEFEEFEESLLGVSAEEMNDYYHEVIDAHCDADVWPYIQIPLGDGKFVELEFAAGSIEYQDRFWLGDSKLPKRVLLGYHSGHFSLPAFRFEEIVWLHDLQRGSPRTATLLLMSACYLPEPTAEHIEFVTDLITDLPGADVSVTSSMVEAFIAGLSGAEVRWEHDARLGWTNNGLFSQRNPKCKLSILSGEDFAFIERFFRETDDATRPSDMRR